MRLFILAGLALYAPRALWPPPCWLASGTLVTWASCPRGGAGCRPHALGYLSALGWRSDPEPDIIATSNAAASYMRIRTV
eukprot:scaffold368360_cov50-Prasinocladus_malaysianus.AAC.1